MRESVGRSLCAASVVALYGAPLVLIGLLGASWTAPTVEEGREATRARVFWSPPVAVPEVEAVEPAPLQAMAVPTQAVAIRRQPVIEAVPTADPGRLVETAVVLPRPRRPYVRAPPTKKQQRRKKRKDRRFKRLFRCEDMYQQMVQVADREVWISRDLINCYRRNPTRGWFVAETRWAMGRDGKPIGFRIQPRPNSKVGKQLGLRPGDVVVSVNGFKLRNWAQVMAAAPNVMRGKLKFKLLSGEKLVVDVRPGRVIAEERVRRGLALAEVVPAKP